MGWISPPCVQTGPFSGEVGKQLACYLFLVATRSGGTMSKVVGGSKIWEQTGLICSVLQPMGRLLSSDAATQDTTPYRPAWLHCHKSEVPLYFHARERLPAGRRWGGCHCVVFLKTYSTLAVEAPLNVFPHLWYSSPKKRVAQGYTPLVHVTWSPQWRVTPIAPASDKGIAVNRQIVHLS